MHKMSLKGKYFNLIKSGEKTIELRLLDEKRAKIKIGDEIRFTHIDNSSDFVDVKVIDLHVSSSFANLFKSIDVKKSGFTNVKDMKDVLETFYPIEKQEELGVVGIEIERI